MKKITILLFCIFSLSASPETKQKVLDYLFAKSIRHIFNVDDEHFLLNLAYNQEGLHYRAVYPFSKIETSGTYRLSTKISNAITIKTSDVFLDLNGNTVTGGISVDAGLSNIVIRNGAIAGAVADGLKINGGCSNIILEDLVVRSATRGINCQNLTNATIVNCDMSRNTTGLELDHCANIVIENCTASRNINAGFCLLTSTTCCLKDCKALSNGQSNTSTTNQTVFGFVASNGKGNIFERCISNSTQALSTTDFNSIVAGFALRGTESCSQIINCQSDNTQTNFLGVTIPYGILLESSISSQLTLTGVPPLPLPSSGTLTDIEWSPDGAYFAVGGQNTEHVQIYSYNRQTNIATRVASNTVSSSNVTSLSWCGDGRFLAVGTDTDPELKVLKFEPLDNSLSLVATLTSQLQTVNAVDFSPDGQFIAIGMIAGTDTELEIYKFDRVAFVLTQYATLELGVTINAVKWRPDGLYVAVGTNTSPQLRVHAFSIANATIASVATFAVGSQVFDVDWSPDGRLIAAGENASPFAHIYNFSGTALTQIAQPITADIPTTSVLTINWSGDGRDVVTTSTSGDTNGIRVYQYDRGNMTLTQVSAATSANKPTGDIRGHVSPDGGLIIAAAGTDPNKILAYTAFSFPSNNVINDNIVSCNSGGSSPFGFGIAGSSIANMMLGNTAFDNPISPFVAYTPYAFVTNIFDQNFGDTPTELQNLKFASTDPIAIPNDTNICLLSSLSKACDIQSKVDVLLTIYG